MDVQQPEVPRILRRPKVEDRTGLVCSTIYRLIADGEFPKPVKLGPRAVGWLESDISAWISKRAAERVAA